MTTTTKTFLEWTPALSVLVQEMDSEHQALIALMNTLFDLNARGADKAAITKAFDTLAEYTVKHFADEERYMASVKYPDLENHKRAHKQLLDCVQMQRRDFAAGGNTVPAAVFAFFKNWLTSHILGVDIKYGRHAKTADQKPGKPK